MTTLEDIEMDAAAKPDKQKWSLPQFPATSAEFGNLAQKPTAADATAREAELSALIVDVYRRPLEAFYDASPPHRRVPGVIAEQAVQDFFVSKLFPQAVFGGRAAAPGSKPAVTWLRLWLQRKAKDPGRQLRWWLAKGLRLWVRSELNRRHREASGRVDGGDEMLANVPVAPGKCDPIRVLEREVALNTIAVARRQAEAALKEIYVQVAALHWDLGRTYPEITRELGLQGSQPSARGMFKEFRERWVKELRDLVGKEYGYEGVDRVIDSYLEAIRS